MAAMELQITLPPVLVQKEKAGKRIVPLEDGKCRISALGFVEVAVMCVGGLC